MPDPTAPALNRLGPEMHGARTLSRRDPVAASVLCRWFSDVCCAQDEDKQLLRNGHVLHEQEKAAQRAARVARKAALGGQDAPLPPSLSLRIGEVSEETVASSRTGSTRNRTASRRKRQAGWGKPTIRHPAPLGSHVVVAFSQTAAAMA